MHIVRAFFMALGMFTAIPCPYRPWEEESRGIMLACLPIVGALIGLIWTLIAVSAKALLPSSLGAAFIAAQPYVLTGFIHLDGFMDVSDAILSWRPLEKRLEILKDPHIGAFAAINVVLVIMFSYGSACCGMDLRALALIPVVSRCGSAFAVSALPALGHSEYAALGRGIHRKLAVVLIWAITIVAGVVWLGAPAAALLVETVAYAAAMAWAFRTLKGVSGDLAGFALTISECCALIALAVIGG